MGWDIYASTSFPNERYSAVGARRSNGAGRVPFRLNFFFFDRVVVVVVARLNIIDKNRRKCWIGSCFKMMTASPSIPSYPIHRSIDSATSRSAAPILVPRVLAILLASFPVTHAHNEETEPKLDHRPSSRSLSFEITSLRDKNLGREPELPDSRWRNVKIKRGEGA